MKGLNYQTLKDLALRRLNVTSSFRSECLHLGCHKPEHAEVIYLRPVNERLWAYGGVLVSGWSIHPQPKGRGGSRPIALKATLIFIIIILINIGSCQAEITDAGVVNKIIHDINTPILEPGESGILELVLTNPSDEDQTFENITLTASIYLYKTTEESESTADISEPPVFSGSGSTQHEIHIGELEVNDNETIQLTVSTSTGTPHGSYFSQSSYFVSFSLVFDHGNQTYAMASRGYFTDDEWYQLTYSENDGSGINRTYLSELGYDGIIPETSFTVVKPVPMWPYLLLVALTIFVGFIAFSMYIMESDDAKHAGLKKGFQKMWGKFYQFRKLAKHRLGGYCRKIHVSLRGKK